ncbi:hypothetical protein [Streptomyces rimosus]|uniref:hypothetical protein n=1 Tax=Streptomyces rimosus TaxID=1927 RepID=UPI00131BB661|nr:hypothetical protein [Streptomyces rimosus]
MKSWADSKRVRIEIESRASYRIMWLAGVRQLDLSQHCLKTFAESDRYNANPNRRTQTLDLPAENPPAAWYLCALPIPWDWARNAHLAFEYASGATWEGDALVGGLRVRLSDAAPITGWGEHSIPQDAPRRSSYRYRTCRNWQFAWWLHTHRDVPDTPHPPRGGITDGPRQLTLE